MRKSDKAKIGLLFPVTDTGDKDIHFFFFYHGLGRIAQILAFTKVISGIHYNSYSSPRNRYTNCRSSPFNTSPSFLSLVPSSVTEHLLHLIFSALTNLLGTHISSSWNFCPPTHCFISAPNASKHSLGTCISLRPAKRDC